MNSQDKETKKRSRFETTETVVICGKFLRAGEDNTFWVIQKLDSEDNPVGTIRVYPPFEGQLPTWAVLKEGDFVRFEAKKSTYNSKDDKTNWATMYRYYTGLKVYYE